MPDEENPLYPFLLQQQAIRNENLIRDYAECGPDQLLEMCEEMIHCLAGFDTSFLLSPSSASHHLGLIGDGWLAGFDRTLELLCLAAVERKIDISPFKSLASVARSFWTKLAGPESTRNGLISHFENGTSALYDLKRALLIEIAQHSRTARRRDPDPAAVQPESAPSAAAPPKQTKRGERPERPDSVYCLPKPGIIRWDGETNAQPRLCNLLRYILDLPGDVESVPVHTVKADGFGDASKGEKSFRNDVGELSVKLLAIKFPWSLHVKDRKLVISRD